jgi:hypothetical protein
MVRPELAAREEIHLIRQFLSLAGLKNLADADRYSADLPFG